MTIPGMSIVSCQSANYSFHELELRLGYSFDNRQLLATALTHRSYRSECRESLEDNQRLEFLGDAVLGLLSADFAYQSDRVQDEGEMTTFRSRMASGRSLAAAARSIGLGQWLRLGRGERKAGGDNKDSILADALESVLGASFIDGGIEAAGKIFARVIAPLAGDGADRDRKSVV